MPSTTSKAKKPQDHKPKSTFGKKAVFPLTLPSGSTIQVTRPGVQGLIKDGVLASLDSLTGIVQTETIPKAEGRKPMSVKDLSENSGKIEEMLEAMDKIVIQVVVEPKLHRPIKLVEYAATDDTPAYTETVPLPEDERDEELAYIDYVDETDKSFIMQFALGGSADLTEFRKKTEEAMGGVPAIEAAPEAAE